MKNQIKTILLLGVLSTILIGFAILALALNLGAYFFSDEIVLRMHHAQPVDEHQAPRLYAMLRELAQRAEIPIAAAVAGAIAYIANMLQFTAIFGGGDDDAPNPIAALALGIVAPITATLVQFGISRSREYLADETGARLSNDFSGTRRLVSLFSTHPPMAECVRRLRGMTSARYAA
jgi:Zn-dependent protease with chaperone function